MGTLSNMLAAVQKWPCPTQMSITETQRIPIYLSSTHHSWEQVGRTPLRTLTQLHEWRVKRCLNEKGNSSCIRAQRQHSGAKGSPTITPVSYKD